MQTNDLIPWQVALAATLRFIHLSQVLCAIESVSDCGGLISSLQGASFVQQFMHGLCLGATVSHLHLRYLVKHLQHVFGQWISASAQVACEDQREGVLEQTLFCHSTLRCDFFSASTRDLAEAAS